MKPSEAKKVLAEHGFTPGVDSTRKMPPALAELITRAAMVLAVEAAQAIARAIEKKRERKRAEPEKPRKNKPRTAADVKKRKRREKKNHG